MKINFYKYQGAGNDFVMIDDREEKFVINQEKIAALCDRNFGIGGDGLILLRNHPTEDFQMVYFNSDGNESTMCGNGGRCIAQFAYDLGLTENKMTFQAIDGLHHAEIQPNKVALQMIDVNEVENHPTHYFMNTGSPHHVEFSDSINAIDVFAKGKEIRYGSPYFENGSNVNFVELIADNHLAIRTYERGVEDETLACGTGVTAAAIAAFDKGLVNKVPVKVDALGGNLEVNFEQDQHQYKNVWLIGPAKKVFKGSITVD